DNPRPAGPGPGAAPERRGRRTTWAISREKSVEFRRNSVILPREIAQTPPSPVRGTDQGAHRRPGRRRRRTRRQLQRRPRGCSLGTAAQRVELDRRERRADTGSERRLRSDRARMIPADQKRSNSVTESTFCQPYSRNDNFTVPCEENLSPLRSLQRSFLLVSNPFRGKSNSDTPLI